MTCVWLWFFFFNDTATTEIYTLSLHDALPISDEYAVEGHTAEVLGEEQKRRAPGGPGARRRGGRRDRKSTRLNSSHANISYAVFCLKKKKNPLYSTFTLINQNNYKIVNMRCCL